MSDSVTITISNQPTSPFVKKGEIIQMRECEYIRYAIVLNDSQDGDVIDEEFGLSIQATFKLRPLSKYRLIRYLQIKYYHAKFYIQKKLNQIGFK